MAYQLPSNIGAFFCKTEVTPGTAATISATDALRVLGTPTFKSRGPAVITDRNSYTPYGGGIQTVTGGRAWSVEFQTEFYMPDPATFNTNPLAPLFRACPLGINEAGADVHLTATPLFNISAGRSAATDIQPCTLQWQETGGRQWTASGCVGRYKMTFKPGDRILIDWSFNGLWNDVEDSDDTTPTYDAIQSQPVIYQGGTLTNYSSGAGGTGTITVATVSEAVFDSGIKLDDVMDGNQTYGFAMGFTSLAESPSLEITVQEATETNTPSFTQAIANTAWDWAFGLTVGARTLAIALVNAQIGALPEVGEAGGYRTQKLKLLAPAPVTGTTPQYEITLA